MNSILLICNESKTVLNFRKEFILFLKKRGIKVDLIVGDATFLEDIAKLGIGVHLCPFTNRSINPFSSFHLIRRFRNIIREIKPDVVFTFQIKPNIFGSLAARTTDAKLFNMVEGLGDPFQPSNLKERLIRKAVCFLYKRSFRLSDKVFFLNDDDRNELINRKVIRPDQCVVIPGIGIDTSAFVPVFSLPEEKRVVYLSRLIKNKGIFEFCEIARKTREKRSDIFFDLYGSESQIKVADIERYIKDGSVRYFGYVTNPQEVLVSSRILLSTSYREGFPRIILEAMALGRPVIASNVIGNKDVVKEGQTGFLIDKTRLDLFVERIVELIDDTNELIRLGKTARQICEDLYDSERINRTIMESIDEIESKPRVG